MQVFYNSPVNYGGQALEQMRWWLNPQALPCFTLSWVLARSGGIYVNPQNNTAVVR